MCDEREGLLSYLYGECDAEERRRIERHLDDCAECRKEVSSLGSVRQDLLAWEVPDHGSVWRPFVPARLTPWWRDVPAWALAAAAAVVFAVGAAGGMLTHAVLAPAALQAAVPAPAVQASVTPADLAALEQRLLATMQVQMDQRVALASSHSQSTVDPASVLREMRAYIKTSQARDQQVVSLIQDLNNDLATVNRRTNRRIDTLDMSVKRIGSVVSSQNR